MALTASRRRSVAIEGIEIRRVVVLVTGRALVRVPHPVFRRLSDHVGTIGVAVAFLTESVGSSDIFVRPFARGSSRHSDSC